MSADERIVEELRRMLRDDGLEVLAESLVKAIDYYNDEYLLSPRRGLALTHLRNGAVLAFQQLL